MAQATGRASCPLLPIVTTSLSQPGHQSSGTGSCGSQALSLCWPRSVKHTKACFLSRRQGHVLGGQSGGQHLLCLPGHQPFRAFRLKRNATQSLLQISLSSASATSELSDLGHLHRENNKIAYFLGCHNDQIRKCK